MSEEKIIIKKKLLEIMLLTRSLIDETTDFQLKLDLLETLGSLKVAMDNYDT